MSFHAYHDSVGEHPEVRKTYNRKAAQQDQSILALFLSQPRYTASPSQVWAVFPQWPLTSIRRSLTNLTIRGELEKLPAKVEGAYGRSEHLWRVVRPSAMEQGVLI